MEPIVAVIDSGIDAVYYRSHPDMFTGTFSCVSNPNGRYIFSDLFPDDSNGHGTMVVDLIHALHSKCKFLVLKILNQDCLATTSSLAAALNFLCTQQVDVVHMSISVIQQDDQTEEITRLCNKLSQQGKFLVCSVENRKKESFPASLPSVIGVTGGVFSTYTDYDFDPDRNIQFVCDATPSVVSGLWSKPSLFGGNSKAACIATSLITSSIPQIGLIENKYADGLLSPLIRTTPFWTLKSGIIPCINANKKIDFDCYEWCDIDVINDVCAIFDCKKDSMLTERMIDACDDLSGKKFEVLFSYISNRLNIDFHPNVLHYVSFEWLWCLFEYVNQVYRQERNTL